MMVREKAGRNADPSLVVLDSRSVRAAAGVPENTTGLDAAEKTTAARTHGIISALTTAQVRVWADKGYQGAGGTVTVPYRGRWGTLSSSKRAVNCAHAKIRALGEQANAVLKGWRLLRKLRLLHPPPHHGHRAGRAQPSPGHNELRLEKAHWTMGEVEDLWRDHLLLLGVRHRLDC
jgi:hypothetical protein